jgi:hypothetical protein
MPFRGDGEPPRQNPYDHYAEMVPLDTPLLVLVMILSEHRRLFGAMRQ